MVQSSSSFANSPKTASQAQSHTVGAKLGPWSSSVRRLAIQVHPLSPARSYRHLPSTVTRTWSFHGSASCRMSWQVNQDILVSQKANRRRLQVRQPWFHANWCLRALSQCCGVNSVLTFALHGGLISVSGRFLPLPYSLTRFTIARPAQKPSELLFALSYSWNSTPAC
jgi:hypothetical protein